MKKLVLVALLGVVSGYCCDEGSFTVNDSKIIEECIANVNELSNKSHELEQYFVQNAEKSHLVSSRSGMSIEEKLSSLLEGINASVSIVTLTCNCFRSPEQLNSALRSDELQRPENAEIVDKCLTKVSDLFDKLYNLKLFLGTNDMKKTSWTLPESRVPTEEKLKTLRERINACKDICESNCNYFRTPR
jgi:hypothetical protein